MKKLFVCLLLCCCCLCACSGPHASSSAEEKEKVTLTLMLPQTHYKDFLKDLLVKFEEEYPYIHIEPQVIPDNQWISVVKAKAVVGETPDLIRIDKTLLMNVGTDLFVEFTEDEAWYNRILPQQLSSKLVDGRLYGLPVGSSTSIGVVYNRSIFEKYDLSIPKTMEEFRQVCDVLLENGVTPLYASDKDSWTAQLGFDAAAPQVVPQEVWDQLKQGKLRWSEVPQFTEILNEMAALRWDGYTNADYLEASYTSAITAIAQEQAAMYITGQFFITDVKKENPDIDLMMMAMPYNGDILTVIESPGQISVFQNTEHLEEAKIFLDWFSQPEQMDVFNAGWNHGPVYVDQQMQLAEFQQVLQDQYILSGKTALEVDNILEGIDMNPFWGYQQKMIAGLMTAEDVLSHWDTDFAEQLKTNPWP